MIARFVLGKWPNTVKGFIAASLMTLAGCGASVERLSGEAFGTTYHVKLVDSPVRTEVVQDLILDELLTIDARVSTWNPDSEVSRFNRSEIRSVTEVSAETAQLIRRCENLSGATGGVFNPQVGPLVELWNFGSRRTLAADSVPNDDLIESARLASTHGYELREGTQPQLVKTHRLAELDFSAMAKGDAVDRVVELCRRERVAAGMVEIGGEVRVFGDRPGGGPWRISVVNPDSNSSLVVLPLRDAAMATSGDYRNYQTVNGVRVSHVIDPRTGRPSTSDVVSATVIASRCGMADAYATACLVFEFDEALRWAERENLAVLLARRDQDGQIETGESQAMSELRSVK